MPKPKHTPVLLKEVMSYLPEEMEVVVDGTIGYGGHAEIILRQNKNIKLIGIDRDEEALKHTHQRLRRFKNRFVACHGRFSDLKRLLAAVHISKVDAIILDLGISSGQLDTPERGFAFSKDGPLDMRLDVRGEVTAEDIINNYSVSELTKIIREFGEERFARRIAEAIIAARAEKDIKTTGELRELIENLKPVKAYYARRKISAATKTFQALRIAVNEELEELGKALSQSIELLNKGGRIIIISFHSLEDRMVKQFFKKHTREELDALGRVVSQPQLRLVVRGPISPKWEEVEANPRARSAKMRVAEKV